MREEYTSACNNTEETHRDWCVCVCVCLCVCVYLCVCLCVCVLCSGCTDALHNIYTCIRCVNQHEGMFMYSVCVS